MSIFNLKTSINEVESYGSHSKYIKYEQYKASRVVKDDAFPNGDIVYDVRTYGDRWFIPNRSYLKIRCSLTKTDGTMLEINDGIAPAMNLAPNLFKSMEFKINGRTVSSVNNHLAQVDTLCTRLSKSDSWLSTVGKSHNFWSPDIRERLNTVTRNGTTVDEIVNGDANEIKTGIQLGFVYGTLLKTALEENTFSYVDATKTLTYHKGTDNAGIDPLDVLQIFPPGSIITFDNTTTAVDGVIGVVSSSSISGVGGVVTLVLKTALGENFPQDSTITTFSRTVDNYVSSSKTRNIKTFDLIYQPSCLGIFNISHAIPPNAEMQFILRPFNKEVFKKYVIESLYSDKIGGNSKALNQYDFKVLDMWFYGSTVQGERFDNGSYFLDLPNVRCQSEKVTNQEMSNYGFDVRSDTHAFSVAIQDQRMSDTRISNTKFRSYNADVDIDDSQENNLERFYIKYANFTLPQPDLNNDIDDEKDYGMQQYNDTAMYSGGYYDGGGFEDINTFRERGTILHYPFPKEKSNRSTRCEVNAAFKNATDIDNMRLLLFDHSSDIVRVTVKDSQVVAVTKEEH